jgi:hypothetical protein
MFALSIRKSTLVVSDDYKAIASFGQACRLAGIQKVSVSRWTGQTRPKYAKLDIAEEAFDAWMSNDTYLPEVTVGSQAIADLAEGVSSSRTRP